MVISIVPWELVWTLPTFLSQGYSCLRTVNQLADVILYIRFLSELTRNKLYNSRFSFQQVWWLQQLNPGALRVEPTQPTTIPPGWFPPLQDKQVPIYEPLPSFLIGCHHPRWSFVFWAHVKSLTCKANVLSTNKYFKWIDIEHKNHKRNVQFWQFPSILQSKYHPHLMLLNSSVPMVFPSWHCPMTPLPSFVTTERHFKSWWFCLSLKCRGVSSRFLSSLLYLVIFTFLIKHSCFRDKTSD